MAGKNLFAPDAAQTAGRNLFAGQAANTAAAGQAAITAAQKPDQLHPLAGDFPGRILHGMEQGIQGAAQLLPRALSYATKNAPQLPQIPGRPQGPVETPWLDQQARMVDQQNAADEQSYQATRRYQAVGEDPGFDVGRTIGEVASPTNAALATMAPAAAFAGSIPRLAASGATMGGAAAATSPVDMSNPDTNFRSQKSRQVATGAAIGAVANPAATRMAEALTIRTPPAPTRDELAAEAGRQYTAATNAGVVVSPQSYGQFVASISPQALRAEGYSPALHPRVAGVLNELQQVAGQPQTLDEMEILRRIARGAARSTDPDEARIGGMIIDRLDDFVGGLGPNDILAGNAPAGSAALQAARQMWTRVRRSDTVDLAIERATNSAPQYSQSGMENALRVQFRQIANNPRRMAQFSDEEQAAIQQVVRGGHVQNALRLLGKMTPTGPVSMIGGAGMGGLLGGAMAGPVGASVGASTAAGIGTASKFAATRMGLNNIRALDELVRRGGPPAAQALSPSGRLAAALATGGAASTGTIDRQRLAAVLDKSGAQP